MQIPFAVGSGKLVHSWQRWRALSHPLMLALNPALKTSQVVQHTSFSSASAPDTSKVRHCTRLSAETSGSHGRCCLQREMGRSFT